MGVDDLEYVRRLARRRAGLMLAPRDASWIESRLDALARREGFPYVGAMIAALHRRGDERLAALVVEALTSVETWFFRDWPAFQRFRDRMLPRLAAARPPGSAIRVWSAGCATGQEPYSLAMLAAEAAPALGGRRVEVLATDISASAVTKARAGVYSQREVQRGVSAQRLVEHFQQAGADWRVRPELRRSVTFRVLSMLGDVRHLGLFDVVFCRYVLTQLAPEAKRDVLARLAAQTAHDGFLVLGAAETMRSLWKELA